MNRRFLPLLALLSVLAAAGCGGSTTGGPDRDLDAGPGSDSGPDADSGIDPLDPLGDQDGDGVINRDDNCPTISNAGQEDVDFDTVGDVCDNCPGTANIGQDDSDGDGTGDACEGLSGADGDDDMDGVANQPDNCPLDANGPLAGPDDQLDTDGDNLGDVCDNCPNLANTDQADDDMNGVGNVCEGVVDPLPTDDDDMDGVDNVDDNCPTIANGPLAGPNDQLDTDSDSRGDVCDNCPDLGNYDQVDTNLATPEGDACDPAAGGIGDTDMDGVQNAVDNCPLVSNAGQEDLDFDNIGDACDTCVCHPSASTILRNGCGAGCAYSDIDGDMVFAYADNCAAVANMDQADTDLDGLGDLCDNCVDVANSDQDAFACDPLNPAYPNGDVDGDMVTNRFDNCLSDSNTLQTDTDDDGIGDVCDNCPEFANANPDGTQAACPDPGPLEDDDMDGVLNYADNCPSVANGPLLGPNDQLDSDGDYLGNVCDECPNQASNYGDGTQIPAAMCDSFVGTDNDSDGVDNLVDNCPNIPNGPMAGPNDQLDTDSDGVGDECDNCPAVANSQQQDTDMDGEGDHCESVLTIPSPCASESSQSSPLPPNLYFVIDDSGSMDNDACSGCGSRAANWNSAVDALDDTLAPDFNLGAAQFSDGNCGGQPTETLDVTAAGTAGLAAAFNTAASLPSPAGGTPTADALRGVYEQVLYELANDPATARPSAVVLVTDGEPTQCDLGYNAPAEAFGSNPNEFYATVERARLLAQIGVPVFVIGFDGVNEDKMEAIAFAGDTANAANPRRGALCGCDDGGWGGTCYDSNDLYNDCWCSSDASPMVGDNAAVTADCWDAPSAWYRVDDTASIVAAMADISSRIVSCVLPIDDNMGAADLSLAAVSFSEMDATCSGSPSGDCSIPNDGTNGYTIDLGLQEMTLHGTWCDYLTTRVQTDPTAQVAIDLGCNCVPTGITDCMTGNDENCNGRQNEECDGAPEICGNGIDDNGDMQIDENCTPGCIPEPEVCEDGIDNDCDGLIDVDDGCPGPVCVPAVEICGDMADNDCDGMADELCGGPGCMPEVCTFAGETIDTNCDTVDDYTCQGPGMPPPVEICGNGVDDNANMQIDENCGDCVPYAEICDGVDNDCDLEVDEGCAPVCYPFNEICNGIDDDCDGVIDDSCIDCDYTGLEICDGIDNNCNGIIDEGCPFIPG